MSALALHYDKAGRKTEALKLREEVLPLVKSQFGLDHRVTYISLTGLAASYATAGRDAEAIRLREETRDIFKPKLGSSHADTLDNTRRLAWLLATPKDPKLCNPTRAVELAKELTNSDPGDGELWHRIGVAQYRASNWQSAVEALRKSMDIRKGGDAFGWLYLTMAHWQLGDKTAARRRYDLVVDWMNKHNSKNESLIRLRNEAAELLGLNEPK